LKQSPSNLKYKKYQKPSFSFSVLQERKRFYPIRGNFGLVSKEYGRLTYKQLEAGRRTIRRQMRKMGFIFIRIFSYVSLTKKALASRMGKGKGSPSSWIAPIRAGQIIYELGGVASHISILALIKASYKMPLKTKVIRLIY
jgi:large subunit ribosomal protein L16